MPLQIYTDGGFRASAGGVGGWAYLFVDDRQGQIGSDAGVLITDTPAGGEYLAIIKALRAARDAGHREVAVYCDCTGVVNQLAGRAGVSSLRIPPPLPAGNRAPRGLRRRDRRLRLPRPPSHPGRRRPRLRGGRPAHRGRVPGAVVAQEQRRGPAGLAGGPGGARGRGVGMMVDLTPEEARICLLAIVKAEFAAQWGGAPRPWGHDQCEVISGLLAKFGIPDTETITLICPSCGRIQRVDRTAYLTLSPSAATPTPAGERPARAIP